MSHASMLKARRKHQKAQRVLKGAAKQARREAKQASATPDATRATANTAS